MRSFFATAIAVAALAEFGAADITSTDLSQADSASLAMQNSINKVNSNKYKQASSQMTQVNTMKTYSKYFSTTGKVVANITKKIIGTADDKILAQLKQV